MAVSGGVKIFEKSKCLLEDGASMTATSGSAAVDYALDRNVDTYWRSVASDDATTETLIVTFDEEKTIDRILILDHNFKGFVIQYDVAGVWTHFASVVGLSGSMANITETTFAKDTAYYEFSEVTTQSIRIQVTTAQTTNAQKYVSQIIATAELGTLVGFPIVKDVESNRNARVHKSLSGRTVVIKADEVFGFDLTFKNYPSSTTYAADTDLMMTLQDTEVPFLVWLCGGRSSTPYFRYTLRGWRLKDVIQMQITKPIKLGYSDGIYTGSLNFKVELEEAV